jgi:hypothetical protein
MIPDLELHDSKELLNSLEVENWKHTLRQSDLCFQELWSQLITFNMRVKGFVRMLEKLLFESVSQVKYNFIGVCFNRKGEEVNFKVDVIFSKIL